jgi:hypothetical protein
MAFFALGLHRYISFDTLRQHREALHAWVDTHPVLAVMLVLYKKVKGLVAEHLDRNGP